MDTSIIDSIVHGLVEPKIYAFLTKTVPRFVKVGDTYRPVAVRIGEWRDKGFPIDDTDVKSWLATLGEGRFFRDYSVHEYLKNVAGMENLSRAELVRLSGDPTAPFSNEFFRFANEESPAESDIDEASGNVALAIEDIRKYDSHTIPSRLTYTVYDVSARENAVAPVRVEKFPRGNQEDAVKRFNAATERIPRKGKTLLMYAVMRFGKTFTSLLCAKEMNEGAGADLVVVVSAKKDVGREWADEVKFTENFRDYTFLDSDNLRRNEAVIDQIKSKSRKFVVFLTLQTFLKKKDWLEQLFKAKIDLLIVDETHFGSRAPKLGGVLKGDQKETKAEKRLREDVDADDDVKESGSAKEERESVATLSLNARVRLHLSGTPYRILMRGEFPKNDIIAFCQYSDIIDAQEAWDKEHLGRENPETGREYAEWENPYYGFPQQVRFAFNPNPAAIRLMERLRSEGRSCRIADIFLPQQDADGNFTGTFAHPDEVAEFLRILDGSDEGESEGFLSLLNHPRIIEGKLCRHVVMVLPRMASCDAMATALSSSGFKTLSQYHVLNISGHNRPAKYDDPTEVKRDITAYAA
ncbi:MAG: DEAD/DEAH box helicase family protein, partial [Kiritimatiellae bacterium]|nr:DEAD/DEAH box helicase family protein [Kiritimatiellia bacterium]